MTLALTIAGCVVLLPLLGLLSFAVFFTVLDFWLILAKRILPNPGAPVYPRPRFHWWWEMLQ
jgi:hypothetical protein